MDAHNAFRRIQEVFEAESLPGEQVEDIELKNALELDDASFTWDAPPPELESGKGKGKDKKDKNKSVTATLATVPTPPGSLPGSARASASQEAENVFKFQKTTLQIPKGQVVAIVGPVGSGKSSFLQGLIGEMRKESGSVKFGGSVSYCPQNAWIQVSVLSLRNVSNLTKRISECHHPRERLLRSAFRF